jgi:hypothetical protein
MREYLERAQQRKSFKLAVGQHGSQAFMPNMVKAIQKKVFGMVFLVIASIIFFIFSAKAMAFVAFPAVALYMFM